MRILTKANRRRDTMRERLPRQEQRWRGERRPRIGDAVDGIHVPCPSRRISSVGIEETFPRAGDGGCICDRSAGRIKKWKPFDLSEKLQELMEDRLNRHEQIMLFLNRRGYAGFISCRECGYVVKCPHCDVSLSFHRGGKMVCHYCGHEEAKPNVCPECGSRHIGEFKAGISRSRTS